MNAYYVQGTVVGAGNTAMNKHSQKLPLLKPEFERKGHIMSLMKMLEKKNKRMERRKEWKKERGKEAGKKERKEEVKKEGE